MDGRHGRLPLVTGANKGIGYEIARQLATRGLTVVLGVRDEEGGKDVAQTMRDEGLDVHPVVLDVTDPTTIRAAAGSIDERFGRPSTMPASRETSPGRHRAPPTWARCGRSSRPISSV
jgi:NAD(P)-dependent dehydrogenase (short-subunit alcohol dehydrogenase family)